MRTRWSPDNPLEWLNRARSSMNLANAQNDEVYLEDLCYQAQQAAEKAIKAIFISLKVSFPYSHDIHHLLTLLEDEGIDIPASIKEAERLSIYAVQTRYPGFPIIVEEKHYSEALDLAEIVIEWAEIIIRNRLDK